MTSNKELLERVKSLEEQIELIKRINALEKELEELKRKYRDCVPYIGTWPYYTTTTWPLEYDTIKITCDADDMSIKVDDSLTTGQLYYKDTSFTDYINRTTPNKG